jgi:hypothetical protein
MSDLELRHAHLGHRRTPAREAQRRELQAHIAEIHCGMSPLRNWPLSAANLT